MKAAIVVAAGQTPVSDGIPRTVFLIPDTGSPA
jgi:hypothetical protein